MIKTILICACLITLFFPAVGYTGSADTVTISGAKSAISAKAIIVLPDTYAKSKKKYPVVYLLHGWSGNYRNWYDKTDLETLTDRFNLIIVCPDGGYAGWYIDSPLNKESKYSTYIAVDVVAYVDQHYRTLPTVSGRAICGLSMGGHGALYLLSTYHEIYAMAGSISGLMELTPYAKRYGVVELLGEFETRQQVWRDYSCIALIDSLKGKKKRIMLDCGTADPFIETNRELHRLMIRADIEHDYVERFGGHSWEYWTGALEYHLLFFVKNGLSDR
jgi:S-formylglutathione hydrolase FrmB